MVVQLPLSISIFYILLKTSGKISPPIRNLSVRGFDNMKENSQPNLLPLYFIIAGSCLLAIPGLYGAMFLFAFAGEGVRTNALALLFPLPAIAGFFLLAGYMWTAARKRWTAWFWFSSLLFNLFVTKISFVSLMYFLIQEGRFFNGAAILLLFPAWTLFVTISSGKYFYYSRSARKLNLP
jgi:hypothetical protein